MLEEKKRQKPGPKPGTKHQSALESWMDFFCDLDLSQQDELARWATEAHRQAKRQASKRWSDPDPRAVAMTRTMDDPLGEASVRAMEEQGRIDGMDGAPK